MPERVCLSCKKSFIARKEKVYCSRTCKHACPVYKAKVSAGNKGKTLGVPLSYSIAGDKNPRWIPDRTKLKTRRCGIEKFLVETWRRQVFERDDYTCQICGERGGKLNADHVRPARLFPELIVELSNGRTLCEACHKETPTFAGKVFKLKRSDFEKGGYLYS